MEKSIIDILTNSAGAVAVAILFVWYIDRQDRRQTKLIENHLEHSTSAIGRMSNVIIKLHNSIKNLLSFLKENGR